MSVLKDWARDYDLFDADYVGDPYTVWDGLRATCPVAHSDRYGGSWLTTTTTTSRASHATRSTSAPAA